MSGWDGMIADETRVDRIRADHQPALTRMADHAWKTYGLHRYAVSYKQAYLRAQRDTIGWIMRMLTDGFDNLTAPEVIRELRKGDQSLYWPLFIDDPTAWLLCDRCRTHQLFTDSGVCPHCGTEME